MSLEHMARQELLGRVLAANVRGESDFRALQALVQGIRHTVEGFPNPNGSFDAEAFEKDLLLTLSEAMTESDHNGSRYKLFVRKTIEEGMAGSHTRVPVERQHVLGQAILSSSRVAAPNDSSQLSRMPQSEAFYWRIKAETIFGFVKASRNAGRGRGFARGPQMAQLLKAYHIEGLSRGECGQKFDIPATDIAHRLHRCVQMLRESFRQEDFL